jgi:hypothetical protein
MSKGSNGHSTSKAKVRKMTAKTGYTLNKDYILDYKRKPGLSNGGSVIRRGF